METRKTTKGLRALRTPAAYLLEGLLVTISLTTSLADLSAAAGESYLPTQFVTVLFRDALTVSLLPLLIAWALGQAKSRFGAFARKPSCLVSGALMALVSVISDAAINGGSLSALYASPLNAMIGLATLPGYGILWGCLANLLQAALDRAGSDGAQAGRSIPRIMGIILLCWLPYLAISWPGTVNSDAYDQIRQVFGTFFPEAGITSRTASCCAFPGTGVLINDAQPVLHTMLLSGFYMLFWRLGRGEIGIFLFVLIQCLLMALAMARSVDLLRRMGAGRAARTGLTLFYALFPLFPLYACSTVKDTAFAAAFLGALVFLMEVYRYPEETAGRGWRMAGGALVLMLFMQFRSFGFWLFAALCALSVPFWIRLLRRNRRAGIRVLCAALIPLALSGALDKAVYPALGVGKGPLRESLSMPLQQTAAYLKAYPDDVTDEERAAIQSLLKIDQIADVYRPIISDPVKGITNTEISGSELSAYFRAYCSQFLRHPLPYLEAAVQMGIGYFTLTSTKRDAGLMIYLGNYQYIESSQGVYDRGVPGYVGIRTPAALQKLCVMAQKFIRLLVVLPGFSLLFTSGLYIWLFFMALLNFARRRGRGAALMLPLAIYILGLPFSPVAGSTRYAFPVHVCAPLCVLFAALQCRPSGIRETAEIPK